MLCTVGKLCVYSGVLCVGVGDAMAALAGSLLGRTKWPGQLLHCVCVCMCVWTKSVGTTKTLEGTLMSVLSQLCALLAITLIGTRLCTNVVYMCYNVRCSQIPSCPLTSSHHHSGSPYLEELY